MDLPIKPIGRVGYDAYAASTGGKTFDGRDMPTWEELPERIRDAWQAAARSVVDAVRDAVVPRSVAS